MDSKIKKIKLRKILDSRGNPTVECEIYSVSTFSTCSAPSGASVGKFEAVAYPNGVDKAIEYANSNLLPKLIGADFCEQRNIDHLLREIDGTENFSKIGGNVAMVISIACAKLAAYSKEIQLFEYLGNGRNFPLPLSKIIGGGKHALNSCDIQEFLSVPTNAKKIYPALEANLAIHKKVAEVIVRKTTQAVGRDDESGWVARLKTEEALEILSSVCEAVSDEKGIKVMTGLDVAANSLFDGKGYMYKLDGKKFSKGEQIDFILELIKKFNLAYVEDPLYEEDLGGFAELTKKAKNCLICGDDIFVTNKKKLELGVKSKACNSIVIKPNQIGTLSDLADTVKYAKENNYTPIASHRSGETCDDYLAHIAVAYECKMLKTNVVGGERNTKFNEIIRIGERIGKWV